MSIFQLDAQCGEARAGTITTAHGVVKTPIFMPVGTKASVKMMDQDDLKEVGSQIILGNTYHLYLRPGHELIERVAGGLHGFMSWDKPILTDSGGFQVFSLSKINKISEEGVIFQSHLDGSKHLIGPEKSMEIQRALGSDIVMAFDECPALPATKESLRTSMELTLRWAKRCFDYRLKDHQSLFGIVQGGLNLDLRLECLERLEELNPPGMAIGGLSVGEKNEEMEELLKNFTPQMNKNKPRYLMGVGKPMDVLKAIKNGIDMFDCVLPTRNARNGQALTSEGPLNIKKERFKEDKASLDENCECKVCKTYSRAYLRHLYQVKEPLVGHLITYHNLHFYLKMVNDARDRIIDGTFDDFFDKFSKLFESNRWIN